MQLSRSLMLYLLNSCAALLSSTLTNPCASSCLAHNSTIADNDMSGATGPWRAEHFMTAFVLGLTSVMESGSTWAQASRLRIPIRPNFLSVFDIVPQTA